MIIALYYYAFGLLWLLGGLGTGWLRWHGDPFTVAIWVIAGAAVWPWLLGRMIWDICHGRRFTDFQ